MSSIPRSVSRLPHADSQSSARSVPALELPRARTRNEASLDIPDSPIASRAAAHSNSPTLPLSIPNATNAFNRHSSVLATFK